MGYDAGDLYSYENENWLRFDQNKQLSGIYGYSDPTTNKLNAIGFVTNDISCTNRFIDALGRNGLSWTSPIPGTEVALPQVPSGLNLDILPTQTPRHEHEKEVDPGLIAVCVLVYVFIAILLVVFIMQYCKEKQNGLGVAPGRGKYSAE